MLRDIALRAAHEPLVCTQPIIGVSSLYAISASARSAALPDGAAVAKCHAHASYLPTYGVVGNLLLDTTHKGEFPAKCLFATVYDIKSCGGVKTSLIIAAIGGEW
jgi:hypothetical protein